MLVQEKQKTKPNRINRLYPDHFIWINSQIKANKYLATRGREVFIKKPGTSSANIVNIPPKEDPNYFNAWVKVYNYALDYLEGIINYACKENKYIRNHNGNWILNGKAIIWPKFEAHTAKYAEGLDRIYDEYALAKMRQIKAAENEGVKVQKTSTFLKKVDEVKVPEKIDYTQIKNQTNRTVVKKDLANSKLVFVKNKPTLVDKNPLIQKVSDGDILNNRDISKLRNSNTDIVVLTCQDILSPKEEDIFLGNVQKCQNEGFNTGAYIYGRGTNKHAAAIEIKRILKMLNQCGNDFSRLVIYSINNDYVLSNKDSEIKLLDFINMYNAIGNTLKQYGYNVMISMSLESGKIIENINEKYNIQNEHEIIYTAFVRDVSEIDDNTSSIVIDPGNDYDIVNIRNREFITEISKAKAKKN